MRFGVVQPCQTFSNHCTTEGTRNMMVHILSEGDILRRNKEYDVHILSEGDILRRNKE